MMQSCSLTVLVSVDNNNTGQVQRTTVTKQHFGGKVSLDTSIDSQVLSIMNIFIYVIDDMS